MFFLTSLGNILPKCRDALAGAMAARTGWVSLQELGELCSLEGARSFCWGKQRNKGKKLLQELGQGWGAQGALQPRAQPGPSQQAINLSP